MQACLKENQSLFAASKLGWTKRPHSGYMDYAIKTHQQHKISTERPACKTYTHTLIHTHIMRRHTHTHTPLPAHLLLEDTGERKEKPNSRHTEKAFLQCASSCAHPGLASGWRLCCTLSTCMASPAVNGKRSPWIWVNLEPSLLR